MALKIANALQVFLQSQTVERGRRVELSSLGQQQQVRLEDTSIVGRE